MTIQFVAARVSSAIAIGTALFVAGAGHAIAQKKGASAKDLVGTWTAVSVTTTQPDGKKSEPFGSKPVGILNFDSQGRYNLQVCKPGRAKFAANARDKGTADENRDSVTGCNPHWGKYTVADGAINFQIEHAMYPNWEGTTQKRTFTIKGDTLTYNVPAASTGGTAEVVWKRAK